VSIRSRSAPLLILTVLASACGGGGGDTAAPAPGAAPSAAPPAVAVSVSPEAQAEAQQIFATRCFTCHGQFGKGDGPGSAGLTPKPRDLTSPEWQAKVNDEHIEQIIRYGGAAVGLSPMMPPNPDLVAKPEVVTALRLHVRSLKAH